MHNYRMLVLIVLDDGDANAIRNREINQRLLTIGAGVCVMAWLLMHYFAANCIGDDGVWCSASSLKREKKKQEFLCGGLRRAVSPIQPRVIKG